MSDLDHTSTRITLARAIQSTATAENDLEDRFLSGFVTIAEWIDPEGSRYLTLVASDDEGRNLAEWTVEGFLHNTLHGDLPGWVHAGDDDEEDDES